MLRELLSKWKTIWRRSGKDDAQRVAPAQPAERGKATRDIVALTKTLAMPAVQVVTQDKASLSHFGGAPCLPTDTIWPQHKGAPLGFLARISLTELHQAYSIDWLPSTGALLFFYDLDEQPWGFDPADRGAFRVLHVPDAGELELVDRMAIEQRESPIPFHSIGFKKIETLPSWERVQVDALELNDAESDTYCQLCDATYLDLPRHQVGGFPLPIQGDDMERECQFVSHGFYLGKLDPAQAESKAALEPGASDWRLLFQFDSDEDIGVMWGDVGTIYYWVRENEARQGDFSNAWLVLQCH